MNSVILQSPTLKVSNLRKLYGDTVAVDGISFELRQNEILGLLGPNGAGKTTTINMILGVLKPTAGEISVDGMDITHHRSKILERTNFAAVYAPLPGNLTVAQNLRIFGLLYGISHISEKIEELLTTFDLVKFRNTKCGVLSSGEQTRVGLAKAFINDPTLLLLDEPTASLDPSKALEIRTLIREFAHKKSVAILLTSHNMYEVEHICDRVLFLSKGKILLEGDPKSLPSEHGKSTLEDLFITVAREPLSLERSPAV
ncbi:MAG: ABC transporter ATP-binding protein [Candidatus Kapaibacterium sp.]